MSRHGECFDVVVIGAGAVGLAVAHGLNQRGHTVCVVDEGDFSFKASRGNFGLVWVQGKGARNRAYGRWTMDAAEQWPAFAASLLALTGVDVGLSHPGGFTICLDEQELQARADLLGAMKELVGDDFAYQVLNAVETSERLPGVSGNIAGSVFCPLDRHVNPLMLLRALSKAHSQAGGGWLAGSAVDEIVSDADGGYLIRAGASSMRARKVVLCAGLGNRVLAQRLGVDVPVRPVRGQIMITERIAPFLQCPTLHVRQTGDGTVQIGDSKEEVGFDDGTSMQQLSRIARRAVRCFPGLRDVRVVRSWGALRVMSQDGYPIYAEPERYAGLYVVTCHSGITLAPLHASTVAHWIGGGERPDGISEFRLSRFQATAH